MDVESDFLTGSIHDELPYTEVIRHGGAVEEMPAVDVERLFPRVLAHRDVASREPLYQSYDAVVRGNTVLARGAADAGVIAPVPGSHLGVALAVAGNPRYGRIDPGYAAEAAVIEAMRRVAAVGARPLGLTDCLNFGNPRKPDHYGEFVAAVDGLSARGDRAGSSVRLRATSASTTNRVRGGPFPLRRSSPASARSTISRQVVTPGLKRAESALLWIGSRELAVGGSVLAELLGVEGTLPSISYAGERAALGILHDANLRGLLLSARAIGAGGMLTALARLSFDAMLRGRAIGAEIDFGNPLCEAGGFICEVSDEREVDLTGTLRIGQTLPGKELVVNGVRFDIRGSVCNVVAAARGSLSVSARIAECSSFRERTRKTRRCVCCAIAGAMRSSSIGPKPNACASTTPTYSRAGLLMKIACVPGRLPRTIA